ncbi:hypothetical protein BDB00DRAFT_97100 [Zychaea mexicana]|uniref:uncharacterized protein n=1 Tax=Zychaea mexicana TaxID=64656 RepID=UPI0022FF411A|nr:uncharacterized protein BDB00DRAFT_97100 [Zychaea mexicana]KAI9496569.1 hypothetical protein BDB00DRAFT_97100 [Zychaea mexicana]
MHPCFLSSSLCLFFKQLVISYPVSFENQHSWKHYFDTSMVCLGTCMFIWLEREIITERAIEIMSWVYAYMLEKRSLYQLHE